MVRIVNCCYSNLKQNIANTILGEDITTEIIVGTSPIILLASVNLNRKIVKLFSVQYSNKLAQLWVRHGINININNAAFAMPENYLYINTSQASQPLSIVMSAGTALVKFTVVNKS